MLHYLSAVMTAIRLKGKNTFSKPRVRCSLDFRDWHGDVLRPLPTCLATIRWTELVSASLCSSNENNRVSGEFFGRGRERGCLGSMIFGTWVFAYLKFRSAQTFSSKSSLRIVLHVFVRYYCAHLYLVTSHRCNSTWIFLLNFADAFLELK